MNMQPINIEYDTSRLPQKEPDYEEGLSIEQGIQKQDEEEKIDQPTLSRRASSYIATTLDTLRRLKSHMAGSLDDVNANPKSLSVINAENGNPIIPTIGELNEEEYLGEEPSPKKWVIYDMVKLGFEEEQILEAVEFMETLPEDLTRENLMTQVVEHFADKVSSLAEVVEKWEKTELKEEKLPKVVDTVTIEIQKPKGEEFRAIEKVEEVKEVKEVKETKVFKKSVPCHVCFNYLSEDEVKPMLKCSHAFCRECYGFYLEQLIKVNKVLDMTCPHVGCTQKFEDKQVVELLNKEQGERYMRLKNIAVLNKNPDLRWCIRPGCDKYVVGNGKTKKLVCECKAEICFNCGNKYHGRKSCNAAVDKVYKKYAKDKHVQNCPQCKSSVEKNGGCNHMTCTRCTYQWCWLCEEKYTYDHYETTNPNHCTKLKKKGQGRQQPENSEPVERVTYWSDICKEPLRLIAFPLFLMIVSAMLPQYLYGVIMSKKKGYKYDVMATSGTGLVFFFALLGIVLLPVSAGFMLICLLLDAVIDFWIWLCRVVARKDVTARCPRPFMPQVL